MKILERRYTRDAIIPRVAGDDEHMYGYRCIPLPPTNDGDWIVFDSSRKRTTGWQRVRELEQLKLFPDASA
jgi:hypothetical protein